jgi:hypothetical protein
LFVLLINVQLMNMIRTQEAAVPGYLHPRQIFCGVLD